MNKPTPPEFKDELEEKVYFESIDIYKNSISAKNLEGNPLESMANQYADHRLNVYKRSKGRGNFGER